MRSGNRGYVPEASPAASKLWIFTNVSSGSSSPRASILSSIALSVHTVVYRNSLTSGSDGRYYSDCAQRTHEAREVKVAALWGVAVDRLSYGLANAMTDKLRARHGNPISQTYCCRIRLGRERRCLLSIIETTESELS